ncbi:MAG: tripartite tricarboxylate transporter substrate binding protein [Betaproteobacteria bacterium]|nr:tripartite tricarboxylate transporter substrate binding protein [Betaproteobacteria bacterium]
MKTCAIWKCITAGMAGAALLNAATALAQDWPTKPVRVVVPFGTGGGTDIQARLLAINLRKLTGQSFIVDNRSGAGGLIGAELVVNSPPDGHTILFTTATLAINTTLYSKGLKFSTRNDLVPSTLVSNAPNVLCVHPSVPANSVKELIALAKRTPSGLNNGVNTPGSTSHLAAEMLAQLANINTVIVPYTGGGPSMAGLVTGDIDMLFATGPVAAAALKTGRVRCLAVTTAEKNRSFPDLPAIQTAVPGLVIGNWYAMFFPKGTPGDIVNRLGGLIKQALNDEKIKSFYAREGLEPVGSSPAELRAQFQRDVEKYAQVIKSRNIPLR